MQNPKTSHWTTKAKRFTDVEKFIETKMQKGSLKQIRALKQKGSLKTTLKVEKKTNKTLLQTTKVEKVY